MSEENGLSGKPGEALISASEEILKREQAKRFAKDLKSLEEAKWKNAAADIIQVYFVLTGKNDLHVEPCKLEDSDFPAVKITGGDPPSREEAINGFLGAEKAETKFILTPQNDRLLVIQQTSCEKAATHVNQNLSPRDMARAAITAFSAFAHKSDYEFLTHDPLDPASWNKASWEEANASLKKIHDDLGGKKHFGKIDETPSQTLSILAQLSKLTAAPLKNIEHGNKYQFFPK